MTLFALDPFASSDVSEVLACYNSNNDGSFNSPTVVKENSAFAAVPRITLRKRPFSMKKANLEGVNSAFFHDLFADVARVEEEATIDANTHEPLSKKSRLHCAPIARCGRSFKVLSEALSAAAAGFVSPESPSQTSTSFFDDDPYTSTTTTDQLHPPRREDSLQFQLNCVLSSSSTDVSSATNVAFPHLPSTVSDSSYPKTNTFMNPSTTYSKLTRVISDLQSSDTETRPPQETYGWFVEMEDDESLSSSDGIVSSAMTVSSCPLPGAAFQAPTAPKAEYHHDAELEWAAAADTVDDVLGDFF